MVVRVEGPDDDPGEPVQDGDREEDAREADGEIEVAARLPEGAHEERRREDEERRHPPSPSSVSQKSVDATRHARVLSALEELREDRDEAPVRAASASRADEVRDLDRDGERVDLPATPK